MMVSLLALSLSLLFAFLGVLHLYWLVGGTWALNKVIPTKEEEKSNLKILPLATLLVALGLLFLAFVYLEQTSFINHLLPVTLGEVALWFVPILFLIRAIGDFNYVGFFKRVKTTAFAKADSKLFSPLCLGIAFAGFAIIFLG
ncbi:DUF3995 domain-containing protein [Croceivirga sp. JEA036]|uniref:DUF3995 domain-containing protein n=1 Tax=Croceivirga sp. JEA036 TaxID=2721162 RepID=UPI00143B58C0|nr:DUF3995 domain-containing protein [Croceivirga sp. JEA036]NJB37513.1 DUF3995 domain-containing protein [Croceivirga sp. JEA036]